MISPSTCHRFVGHLEEEAVVTYTRCIHEIEAGRLPEWYVTSPSAYIYASLAAELCPVVQDEPPGAGDREGLLAARAGREVPRCYLRSA